MANEFLWKKLTEKAKEEAKIKAKEIMDNFAEKLENIKDAKKSQNNTEFNSRKERTACERKISRDVMFQNAPNKNKNFIIAEKKKW